MAPFLLENHKNRLLYVGYFFSNNQEVSEKSKIKIIESVSNVINNYYISSDKISEFIEECKKNPEKRPTNNMYIDCIKNLMELFSIVSDELKILREKNLLCQDDQLKFNKVFDILLIKQKAIEIFINEQKNGP